MPDSQTAALSSGLRMSVMRLARRLRNQRSAELGLPLAQLTALATLDRNGPMSPGELADCEHVSPPTMTRVLAALTGAGLVERTPHPTDRRQQVVSVTEQAHELLEADRRRRDAWLATRLAALTEDERAVLAAAAPVLAQLAEG
ncbi:MarR family transcriptional regulator [Motilibacter aurantiacus]|uniref:MarR family transcriptional regulator n=1 Tax=Motilibacter aurantiacus TaxID=2714955 RepID=UPI00140DD17E|nr:MarR family transcriptional regulator [Motilibacter aurantiacus]NHC46907.1 MarR family transcriptional regulator [Motilibacter aurantiacus]